MKGYMLRIDVFAFRNITAEESSTSPNAKQLTSVQPEMELYRSKYLALDAAKAHPSYATAAERYLIHVLATLTEEEVTKLTSRLHANIDTMDIERIGISTSTIKQKDN